MQQAGDGAALALLHLGRQQRLEVADVALPLPGGRFGQPGELAADRGQAQRLAVLADGLLSQFARDGAHGAAPAGSSSAS